MAVIFDEVVGTVEEEQPADVPEPVPASKREELNPRAVREQLRRIEQRCLRLRAD